MSAGQARALERREAALLALLAIGGPLPRARVAALPYAEQLIADDPTLEHAHRRLMRLHYLRGDRAAALAAYECCRQLLKLRRAVQQRRVRRFTGGHADQKNEPALRVETVERVAGLPCEWTQKRAELIPLSGN